MMVNAGALNRRKLNDEQVLRILTDLELSSPELAQEYGVNVNQILRIRRGESYRDVHPEIPRRKKNEPKYRTCTVCYFANVDWSCRSHPKVSCTLEIVECEEEGPRWGHECLYFKRETGGKR